MMKLKLNFWSEKERGTYHSAMMVLSIVAGAAAVQIAPSMLLNKTEDELRNYAIAVTGIVTVLFCSSVLNIPYTLWANKVIRHATTAREEARKEAGTQESAQETNA